MLTSMRRFLTKGAAKMKKNLPIFLVILLLVCTVSRGEESIDADTLIASVLRRQDELDSLCKRGIDVRYDLEMLKEDTDASPLRYAQRSVLCGLNEIHQIRFLGEEERTPLGGDIEERLYARNADYMFVLVKHRGASEFGLENYSDDRSALVTDQSLNGLFHETPYVLPGQFVVEMLLRDLFGSDTFRVESVEKQGDLYRLAFRSDALMDKNNRIVGGALLFSADDYSLEGWDVDLEFFIPDVTASPWSSSMKIAYGDWEGLKFPKTLEERQDHGDDRIAHITVNYKSVHLGSPHKEEFSLKYYGIHEPPPPRNPPSPTVFIVVGILLIAAGIYLKRRAATGSAESK